jgi:hypothetical protein
MEKKLCAIPALIALCAVLMAACGGQKPVPYTELAARLGSLKGKAGAAPNTPYTVKIAPINIAAVWRDINEVVYTAGKYLILDLSACSAPGNTIDDETGDVIQDNEYLKGIILPDSITDIGNGAFRDCVYLTSVTISAGTTAIDTNSFDGCTSLSAVLVKSANTVFADEDGVLFNKDKTTLVMYPYGKGTSYSIPASVTSIGEGAFAGTGLTSITIPAGVASIGDSAFDNCDSLATVTISAGLTSIGDSAFRNCGSLASVAIPDSVTNIGEQAFFSCTALTSITIPAGVTSIGNYAFYNCDSLTSVTIPAGVASIGDSAFDNCDSLATVTISEGVTSIGEETFNDCTSLASIIIPESVTSIGYGAFAGTGLTSVTIPASVTSIGGNAFSGTTFTSVTFATGSSIPPDNLGGVHSRSWGSSSQSPFTYDLRSKYLAGGAGTYIKQTYTYETFNFFGAYTATGYTWKKQ